MARRIGSVTTAFSLAAIAALVLLGVWRSRERPALAGVPRAGAGIMGTTWRMKVTALPGQSASAEQALDAAEQRLRELEALMSVHLEASEISHFNAAPPGAPFPLAGDTMTVLTQAGRFAELTDGAFDVTCYPLIRLWSQARKAQRAPDEQALAQALGRVGMRHLQIGPEGVTKLVEGVQVDLGGIAKGFAVDEALVVLRSGGFAGGLIEVGGDLRCFGRSRTRRRWKIAVRHPFRTDATCAALLLTDAAVATSGDYERSYEVSGRRYSHILDPRTGLPVELVPSVTVVSLTRGAHTASAAEADAWATALSVLGPAGLDRLKDQDGLEAMIVAGTPDRPEVFATDGFEALLAPGTKVELD